MLYKEKNLNISANKQEGKKTSSKTTYIIDTPYKTMTILDDHPKIKIKSKNNIKL